MKAYKGVFLKKDGSERTMSFVKLRDIQEVNSFYVPGLLTGTGAERKLPEGMELVYDLESEGFRTFNYASQVGNLIETEIDDSLFV